MISIDRVYKTVLFFVNSDMRGNVKPDELRLAINSSVNRIINDYFEILNRAINRENRGLINGGLENIGDKIREKILYFLKYDELSYENNRFKIPNDCLFVDTLLYNNTTEIEVTKSAQEFFLISNTRDVVPTKKHPVYLKTDTLISILPAEIQSNVSMWYLRKHKIANWTFVVVQGQELFNPDAPDFQDIDLHQSEEYTLILDVLKNFGINLKEQDIQSYAQNTQIQEFNQDNTL